MVVKIASFLPSLGTVSRPQHRLAQLLTGMLPEQLRPRQLPVGRSANATILDTCARTLWMTRRGQPLPRVEYLPEEVATWQTALTELRKVGTRTNVAICRPIINQEAAVCRHCDCRVWSQPDVLDSTQVLSVLMLFGNNDGAITLTLNRLTLLTSTCEILG